MESPEDIPEKLRVRPKVEVKGTGEKRSWSAMLVFSWPIGALRNWFRERKKR